MLMSIFFLAAVTGLAHSQSMPVKKAMRLKSDEVPSIIRSAFEKDFGSIPDNGAWTVHYTTVQSEGKTSATPVWYTYSNKGDAGKIEVTFLPNGKVKFSRGIERKDAVHKVEKQDKTTEGKR
jgi:hypothetical protein